MTHPIHPWLELNILCTLSERDVRALCFFSPSQLHGSWLSPIAIIAYLASADTIAELEIFVPIGNTFSPDRCWRFR